MTHVLPTVRNGVDSAQMFGTLDAIKQSPELGLFQFRASNTWIDGAHNRSSLQYFYGAGQEDHSRVAPLTVDAGEPAVLLGADTGPNPAELLLSALAACLTTTIVFIATARKVQLSAVTSTLTGDMDVRGALGLSDDVRNGFTNIKVHFEIQGDAPDEKLRELVERAKARSAVYDMVSHGVPVDVDVLELTARTEAGTRLVALAETLAQELARRAPEHDREATFPHAGVDALRSAGYFTAPIPAELGGLGVSSAHDVVVASSRLARGDASLAIGVNMHLVVVLNVVRRFEATRRPELAAWLTGIVRDGAFVASAVSEFGQDLTRPGTTATRSNGGWRIDGRKAFCTGSPAATVLNTAVTYVDDRGAERYGYASVPRDAPGVEILGDWDALGMRASGSHSVSFDGVHVPKHALGGGFAIGDSEAYMQRNLLAGLFHASASLGIAESAAASTTVKGEPTARARMLLAENAIDLSAARATLARAAMLVDECAGELLELFAEAQAAKAFVNEASARIVDRALALSGGAGYFNGHPLSRAYRDVRAGSFMHPLGSNRAYDLLGDVALGRAPVLH